MRIVIQRVTQASVTIEAPSGTVVEASKQGAVRSIGPGLVILLGVCDDDTQDDADWLVKKVVALRVFDDEEGVMNRSVMDTGGECLVVSQFTLFASYKKGNRPSWFRAARHEVSVPLYEYFCRRLSEAMQKPVKTGEFGAMMQVALVNDGPVTICMDTKNKE
jgi:D-tyrosyl-tRNA(Tyr) deacylase